MAWNPVMPATPSLSRPPASRFPILVLHIDVVVGLSPIHPHKNHCRSSRSMTNTEPEDPHQLTNGSVLKARHPTSHHRRPHQPAGARSRHRARDPVANSAHPPAAQPDQPPNQETDRRSPLVAACRYTSRCRILPLVSLRMYLSRLCAGSQSGSPYDALRLGADVLGQRDAGVQQPSHLNCVRASWPGLPPAPRDRP